MYNTGSLIEPARLSSYKKSTNTFNGKKTILIPCLSWSFIDEFFFILFTSAVCHNVTLTFHSYIVIIRKLYAIQSQKALDMDIKAEESGITALVNYQFTTSTHKKKHTLQRSNFMHNISANMLQLCSLRANKG